MRVGLKTERVSSAEVTLKVTEHYFIVLPVAAMFIS